MATLIIVRRDAAATFTRLQALWQHDPGGAVEVLWDRRMGERRRPQAAVPTERRAHQRRASESEELRTPEYEAVFLHDERQGERRQRPEWRPPERRQVDRRRQPPVTWRALGFVLVQREPGAKGANEKAV